MTGVRIVLAILAAGCVACLIVVCRASHSLFPGFR